MWVRLSDYSDHQRYEQQQAGAIAQQRAVESELARLGDRFSIEGRCFVCDRQTEFHTDYRYAYPVGGILTPNWREHLTCSGCKLNNRMRATIHLFQTVLRPADGAPIYLMEQTTPLFEWFRRTYPQSIGSEYLGTSIPFGEFNARGIRNERATHLTFASAQFDRVISLDVLEHIPDFRHALAECRRVLRPGGMLLLSVPFRTDRHENMLRAIVEYDGSIRHLEPPEYHGDPLRAEGCLAFHHFGWEFLDQLRSLEFDADAYTYWSRELGYLGARQLLFIAKRRVPDEVPRRGTLL